MVAAEVLCAILIARIREVFSLRFGFGTMLRLNARGLVVCAHCGCELEVEEFVLLVEVVVWFVFVRHREWTRSERWNILGFEVFIHLFSEPTLRICYSVLCDYKCF